MFSKEKLLEKVNEADKKRWWIAWGELLQKYKAVEALDYKDRKQHLQALNLDFVLGSLWDAPCPGVEWALDGESTIRLCIDNLDGLQPLHLIAFGMFAKDIPDSWRGYVSEMDMLRTYQENEKMYIEVIIDPD